MDQKVVVVLVTFNRLDKLRIALDHYEKQTYPVEKIVVVDNSSTDGTVEFLKEWLKSEGKMRKDALFLSENTGGAGGFGSGMDYALELARSKDISADWVLVSDDDAFPEPDAIEQLVNYYNSRPAIEKRAIVSLSSSVINHGKIHEAHRSRVEKMFFRVRFYGVPKEEYNKDGFEIDLFSYVGTMIKVNALEKAGTTNKDLFIYGDDNEHSFRLKKVGTLIVVPKSRFIHDTPGVETRSIGWHNYYNRRNQLYILKKYFPKRYLFFRVLKRYLLDESALSKYNKQERILFSTARKDALAERLGKHPIYKPGFHF